MTKIYQRLAQLINQLQIPNSRYLNAEEQIEDIMANAPSGSGIDCGTKIDLERSNKNRLVFEFDFHHMDENGYYCCWTEHELWVKPSLIYDYDCRITGKDRFMFKDYLYEVYHHWLNSEA